MRLSWRQFKNLLFLFDALFLTLGCVSQPPLSVLELPLPHPQEKVVAAKSLFATELNRPLPMNGAEVQKLLSHLSAPSACAALYHTVISRGTDQAVQAWLKRDLNFAPICLPAAAQAGRNVCENAAETLPAREVGCQKMMGMTRAFLIETLLANDDRPQVATIKAAHALYTLQDQINDKAPQVLTESEILLRQNPRDLDAHLLRVMAFKVLGPGPADAKALATSRAWLAASTEKRHRIAASEIASSPLPQAR